MMKRWFLALSGLLAAGLGFSGIAARAAEDLSHHTEVVSEPYVIDRVYKSMEGPGGAQTFKLAAGDKPELLWVIGGEAAVLDPENVPMKSQEFLCHANIRFDPKQFKDQNPNADFDHMTHQPLKIFNFSQGLTEIRLPRGFGIPVLSTRLFEFNYGVMNPSEPKQPFAVKVGVTFQYLRDIELEHELKPLFEWGTWGLTMKVLVSGSAAHSSHCAIEAGDGSPEAPSGESAQVPTVSLGKIHKNEKGYQQAYHWMIPPGRHIYRYQLEKSYYSELPFDTTIHYATAHVHPYAEFIELRDLTTRQSLFKIQIKNSRDGFSITEIKPFSSEKGLPIYRNHEYEMVCQYNNTTNHDIDAMAFMFVYLLDRNFDREELKSKNI